MTPCFSHTKPLGWCCLLHVTKPPLKRCVSPSFTVLHSRTETVSTSAIKSGGDTQACWFCIHLILGFNRVWFSPRPRSQTAWTRQLWNDSMVLSSGFTSLFCLKMDCFISVASWSSPQSLETISKSPLSLSLLKVFGQGLGPREVTQGQEFALIDMFDQGFPGHRLTSHGLRCYRATGRDFTKSETKHYRIYTQSMVIPVWPDIRFPASLFN